MMLGDVSEDTSKRGRTKILADIGNSMVKLAVLSGVRQGMPCLKDRFNLNSHDFNCEGFENWLMTVAPVSAEFYVASVYEAAAACLETSISAISATRNLSVQKQRVLFSHLPIEVTTEHPEHVGIDRLAAATAASRLAIPSHGAMVIDCGTAVSVDLVSPDGQFLGGAILPGPSLLSRMLADGTSLLPEVLSFGEALPAMPGRSTNSAIVAGIGFGLRGAVCRLVAEARRKIDAEVDVFLTGGWRAAVRGEILSVQEFPDLVLSGIGIAAIEISGL
ncbi:MAG: type III pantothenate kinase [Planctomycetaceae bacterium]|nr:type III pantothenate kinase [Planctomycetaceae bacterium]